MLKWDINRTCWVCWRYFLHKMQKVWNNIPNISFYRNKIFFPRKERILVSVKGIEWNHNSDLCTKKPLSSKGNSWWPRLFEPLGSWLPTSVFIGIQIEFQRIHVHHSVWFKLTRHCVRFCLLSTERQFKLRCKHKSTTRRQKTTPQKQKHYEKWLKRTLVVDRRSDPLGIKLNKPCGCRKKNFLRLKSDAVLRYSHDSGMKIHSFRISLRSLVLNRML